MAELKIQWHPGFYAGLELEFRNYQLEFHKEYPLTRGPLEMDLLVIKKLDDEVIDNQIGNLFRRYNVIEYKSPSDMLDIDVFHKVHSYAGLLKSSGKTVNEIPQEDITVSFFRHNYPRELFRMLEGYGYQIREAFPSIYYIEGAGFFRTQVVVTKDLDAQFHTILRILSRKAHEEDVKSFLQHAEMYSLPGDRARIDAVLEVSSSANRELFEKIYKEEPSMCATLMEIMKDDIDEQVRLGEKRGEKRGEERGEERKELSNIRSLMETTRWTAKQAMDALKIPAEDQAKYAAMM